MSGQKDAELARKGRITSLVIAGTALFWTGAHGLRCDENSYTTAVDAAVCAPLVAGAAEVVRWPTTTSEPRLFVAGVVPRLDDADPFRSSATPLPVELVGFRPGEDLRVELAGIAALRVQLLDRRGHWRSGLD